MIEDIFELMSIFHNSFVNSDKELIYKYLGNGINKKLAYSFTCSGYDMNLLAEVKK